MEMINSANIRLDVFEPIDRSIDDPAKDNEGE